MTYTRICPTPLWQTVRMIDASIDLKGGGTAALDKRDSGSRLPHFERSEVRRAFVKRASASILKYV